MSYLAVNKRGIEKIYSHRPVMYDSGYWKCGDDSLEQCVTLPTGTISKLIGRELSWRDLPVKIVDTEQSKIVEEFSDTYTVSAIKDHSVDWFMQRPLSKRLTDEEKKKIKELFDEAQYDKTVTCNELQVYAGKISEYLLNTIFGPELFKEK